ncbi:hypothetical protein HispidOSU_007607 [Sigmodon hispidus]
MHPSPHPSRFCQPSLSQAHGRRCPYSLRPDIPGIAAHNCTFPGQETSPAGTRSLRALRPLPSGCTEAADPSQMLRCPRDLLGFRPQVRVTALGTCSAGIARWVQRKRPAASVLPCRLKRFREPKEFSFLLASTHPTLDPLGSVLDIGPPSTGVKSKLTLGGVSW